MNKTIKNIFFEKYSLKEVMDYLYSKHRKLVGLIVISQFVFSAFFAAFNRNYTNMFWFSWMICIFYVVGMIIYDPNN